MAAKLSEEAIADGLRRLPHWEQRGDEIARAVEASDFRAAQALVNRLCDLAEGACHHPTVHWTYARVEILLTTHDVGGLSAKDFALAQLIDTIVP